MLVRGLGAECGEGVECECSPAALATRHGMVEEPAQPFLELLLGSAAQAAAHQRTDVLAQLAQRLAHPLSAHVCKGITMLLLKL